MSGAHQNVALAVHKARDQAKTIFQVKEAVARARRKFDIAWPL